jgi:hypothetical protein
MNFKKACLGLALPLLLGNGIVAAEESYQQELAGLDCESGYGDLSVIELNRGKSERISTGKCQFGNYHIEFYQHLGLVHSCYNQNAFCGIKSDDKAITDDFIVVVTNINGDVITTNIDIAENASVIELFRMPPNFPYMALRTNLGGARSTSYLHIFTAKPSFKEVISAGPVSSWRNDGESIYSNERGEWLVDKFVTVPTPHFSALSDWLHFTVVYKLVDDHLERADDHIKKNFKVYSDSELDDIDEEAQQIRALIDAQTDTKWGVVNLLFSGRSDVPLSGKFFRRFTDFVYEGQEELAWRFFERVMPDSYDLLIEDLVPESMYATKSIMRETLKNWINEYFPLRAEN